MPYVRQKTWLPMAPRISGLSLRESPYGFQRKGMGDAGCPSAAQLQTQITGIPDCTDPCQQGYGACAASVLNIPALPVTANQNPLNIGGSNAPLIPANLPLTLSGWLQANQGTVLLVGGGLFALALLRGLK